jgi:hypothetical protein
MTLRFGERGRGKGGANGTLEADSSLSFYPFPLNPTRLGEYCYQFLLNGLARCNGLAVANVNVEF